MPIPAKHSPALAVHNLRNRIAATKPLVPYLDCVDVPIYDAETLLKERDGLIAALEECLDELRHFVDDDGNNCIQAARAVLASARGT